MWNLVFKQPILEALLFISSHTGNLGLAIVLLTLMVQLILLPLRLPSLKSSHKIRKLKPALDKLKEKHEGDKMALAQAQMDLYKEHNISPFGGILPTLLSIPVIIALYQVLLTTLRTTEGINTAFLWFDVASPDPFYILPFLVGGAQLILSSKTLGQNAPVTPPAKKKDGEQNPMDMAQMMQTQMKYIFPVMSGAITATLPAGVGVYWLTSVTFAIIQQSIISRDNHGPNQDSKTTS